MSDTGAVILASGRAVRMEGEYPGLPKALVPVGLEPVSARLVRWLAAAGVAPIAIVWGPPDTGPTPEQRPGELIRDYFATPGWREAGVQLVAGTGLGSAKDAELGIASQRCRDVVLVGCDLVLDLPLADFLKAYRESGGAGCVALTRFDLFEGRTEYCVGSDGKVIGRRDGDTLQWQRRPLCEASWFGKTAGVGVVSASAATKLLATSSTGGFGRAVYDELARSGELVAYDNGDRYLLDIGTPSALEKLRTTWTTQPVHNGL